ncbi:MAG TPA: PAS domain-containing protein, partial [Burkholderiaceae bacterium]|nr:PAS domain-containing protein [Burkholderiaceae bacterium]
MLLKFNFANRWTKVVLLFIIIFLLLAIIGVARLHLLSSVRAFVGAESLYSKSQKDAVFHLEQYASSADEHDFQEYQRAISVPLGDRSARLALDQIAIDYAAAREGFLKGGNNDEDIEDMIYAYRIFRHANFSIDPIAAWGATDQQLIVLNAEANTLHALLQTKSVDNAALQLQLQLSRARIGHINAQLAELENSLSASLGRATRDAQHLLLMMSLAIAVLLLFIGVLVARFILTKSHKLEDALRISEERWHLAMIGSNDGLWDWDIVRRQVYYSPRMCELLGATSAELGDDAMHFETFVHPEDLAPTRSILRAHLRGHVAYDAEFRIITTGGELRWVRSRGQSLRNADGKALRMTGSITDITERKQA